VTVVSLLLGRILISTARTPGHVITAAEQRKASLYTSVCAEVDIRFVPLAQETFGRWFGMASHHISLIADRQADHTGSLRGLSRNDLLRALSVATQRSIAQDNVDRTGRLPEHVPILPPCEESWVRDRGLSEACLFIRKGSVHLLLLIL
jgi:hypothetical protein